MHAHNDSLLGAEIDGRYSITHRLGGGAMGAVYAAIQRSMGREIAIKVIHPELASDAATAKRFLREAWLASRLQSPHVVAIHDFGRTDDGVIYMAMERIAGRTIAEMLKHTGAFEPLRAVQVAMQICVALEAAHELGVVHRDLKPANIMVNNRGDRDEVKVLDFGLAKSVRASMQNNVTEAGIIVGTTHYIAPELIRGAAAAPTSDLYALGAVLYTMLAGRQPFVGDELTVLRSHVLYPPPHLPDRVPPALAAVVDKLLAKDPDDRFATATETREALAVALSRPTPPAIEAALAPETEELEIEVILDELDLESDSEIELEFDDLEELTVAIYEPTEIRVAPRAWWPTLALALAFTALAAAVTVSFSIG